MIMIDEGESRKREAVLFLEVETQSCSFKSVDGIELTIDTIEGNGDKIMPIIGFEASDDLINQLDELKTRTNSATRAEIFRRAIKTYETLTREEKEGKQVALVDAKGAVVKTLILP